MSALQLEAYLSILVSANTELTLWSESAKHCTFSAKVMKGTLMLPLSTLDIQLPLSKLICLLLCCLPHTYNCDAVPTSCTESVFSYYGYVQHDIGTLADSSCCCVVALYSRTLLTIWANSLSCPWFPAVSATALLHCIFILMVALAF